MPTTVRWSPRRELVSLREAMDRLLEESLIEKRVRGGGETRLPIDVYTTASEIVVTAAFPGVPPEEVEVTLDGDTLTIRGELPSPLENVDYIFQERACGRFSRALTLNVSVDVDNIEAAFSNGLLTLTLPKASPEQPKTIKIQTNS
jgi:HSP20 family protein